MLRNLPHGTFFSMLELSCSSHVFRGFAGGSVIKNPPASEGDTGSIPDPGRSHVLWNN